MRIETRYAGTASDGRRRKRLSMTMVIFVRSCILAAAFTHSGGNSSAGQPKVTITKVMPKEGTAFVCGSTLHFVVEMSLQPGSDEPIEVYPAIVVNGCARPAPLLVLTPGASITGSTTWDICVDRQTVDVRLDLEGKGLKSNTRYNFGSANRTYVGVDTFNGCHCRCRRNRRLWRCRW
jgi:hypothetical protein